MSVERRARAVIERRRSHLAEPAPGACGNEIPGKIVSPCPLGRRELDVLQCRLHGPCIREPGRPVGAKLCATCTDRIPLPVPTTRHLLYHVYPRRGSAWRTRLLALRERMELFNGKRLVAIATDGTTEAAPMVEDALAGLGCEFIRVRNNPERREVESFLPLFERLQEIQGPEHCTLFAQAKGVSRIGQEHVQTWTQAIEELYLDYWPVVEGLLTKYPVAGSFKKVGRGWSDSESKSTWHYSGSWFWVRNDRLFAKPDWRRIDQFWSGIEPYPSLHFHEREAGCIFLSASVPQLNLYDSAFWSRTVAPALEKFRTENATRKTGLRPRIAITLIVPTIGRPR
jgi:hypothetical protein